MQYRDMWPSASIANFDPKPSPQRVAKPSLLD
jgi:hypothetical protein